MRERLFFVLLLGLPDTTCLAQATFLFGSQEHLFGTHLDVDGDHLIVSGDSAARLYHMTNGLWQIQQQLSYHHTGSNHGFHVSLDGDTAFVAEGFGCATGPLNDTVSFDVASYTWNGTAWTLQQHLNPTFVGPRHSLPCGQPADFEAERGYVALAFAKGLSIHRRTDDSWVPDAVLQFEKPVARVAIDGTSLALILQDAPTTEYFPAVDVSFYERIEDQWIEQGWHTLEDDLLDVALEGTTAVALGKNFLYTFGQTEESWTEISEWRKPAPISDGLYTDGVAEMSNGNLAVAEARKWDAYLYEMTESGWTEATVVFLPDDILTITLGDGRLLTAVSQKEKGENSIFEYLIPMNVSTVPDEPLVTAMSLTAFPNPSHDVTSVRLQVPEVATVSVDLMDMRGAIVRRVFKAVLVDSEVEFTLQSEGLAQGRYVLRATSEKGRASLLLTHVD